MAKIERPILFSGEMVKAILEGRKSQTRRVVNPQPSIHLTTDIDYWQSGKHNGELGGEAMSSPYGKPGDSLWVRETFCDGYPGTADPILFRATYDGGCEHKWKPSIFMPRWASRINLEITHVRVERIQECSEDDARAEGAPKGGHSHIFGLDETYRGGFATRWDNLNKKRGFGWETNCWVWVIEFTTLKAGQ